LYGRRKVSSHGAESRVVDQGTSSENSVDYPDFGKAVGERVASKKADLGMAGGSSGIGISIAVNTVPGIHRRADG
jgi:ribose 5-phosphate isomerase B